MNAANVPPGLTYPAVVLAREAMATRFELVLPGEDRIRLRAAGEEALEEIERLEGLLSLYRPTSEIARVNARAACEPVRVSPQVFAVLKLAWQLWQDTGGAFDISVAPLVRCWGFMGGTGALPAPAHIAAARAQVGMPLVELDERHSTVRFRRPGVMLDLGAIGKGYAVDCAIDLLREAGIVNALFHGGTSSIYALGKPPDADAWKVAIEAHAPVAGAPRHPLAVVSLREESLSVSAIWGKLFHAEGKVFGHVIDPRTGYPAASALLAAVVLPSAAEADALTTALVIDGKQKFPWLAQLRPGMKSLLAVAGDKPDEILAEASGLALLPSVRKLFRS